MKTTYEKYEELELKITEYVQKLGFKDISDYAKNMTYTKAKELGILNNLDYNMASVSYELEGKINEVAQNKLKAYETIEPEITRKLHSLEQKNAILVSLESKLKSKEGVARKITEKAIEDSDGISVTMDNVLKSSNKISDILRYTYVIDEYTYKDKIEEVLTVFKKDGYSIKIKNNWDAKNTKCKGVNAHLTKIVNGSVISFEIQFHTKDSYMYKSELTHAPYEFERNIFDGTEEFKILSNDARILQIELEKYIETPQNINGWTFK